MQQTKVASLAVAALDTKSACFFIEEETFLQTKMSFFLCLSITIYIEFYINVVFIEFKDRLKLTTRHCCLQISWSNL
jgi:hypothetical protein